jgi:hypothetical protein
MNGGCLHCIPCIYFSTGDNPVSLYVYAFPRYSDVAIEIVEIMGSSARPGRCDGVNLQTVMMPHIIVLVIVLTLVSYVSWKILFCLY